MALIFGSPLIAAVLLLEALGLDREKLPLVPLPGLLASGIGSLVSIGMGSLTGAEHECLRARRPRPAGLCQAGRG